MHVEIARPHEISQPTKLSLKKCVTECYLQFQETTRLIFLLTFIYVVYLFTYAIIACIYTDVVRTCGQVERTALGWAHWLLNLRLCTHSRLCLIFSLCCKCTLLSPIIAIDAHKVATKLCRGLAGSMIVHLFID